MKNVFLFVFILTTAFSKGQMRDNIWPLSYYTGQLYPSYYLDFSLGSPDTITSFRKMSFFVCDAAISDSAGSLILYTNGIWLANKDHDTLLNSSGFNPGYITNATFSLGSPINQSAFFLPFSDTSNLYYVVSVNAENFYNKDGYYDSQPINLNYSIIDLTLDSGKGGIVPSQKNIICINDTLINGRLAACKHANGRDWWVVTHQYYSDMYYILLFTPYGIMGPFTQHIGSSFTATVPPNSFDFDIEGSARFSPDGSKYAMIGPSGLLEILDFDRCSGIFSNYSFAVLPSASSALNVFRNGEFSPSGQFFYANTKLKAYQFNLDSTNLITSQYLIAEYDTFLDPVDSYFYFNQTGPDGKIYISTWNGCRNLHVIENPDTSGTNCFFNQHSFALPSYTGGNLCLPYFPNYRLGRLIGSPCDTLTALPETDIKDFKLKLNPNPNTGNFTVNYQLPQNKGGTLQIFDVLGKQVYSQALPQWSTMQRISLPALPSGIYVVKVTCSQLNSTIKFVKE